MKIQGKVILSTFGKGSKSEHDAVYIKTADNKFRLKFKGGNPFYEKTLHDLVGKNVVLEGELTEHFFEIVDQPQFIN